MKNQLLISILLLFAFIACFSQEQDSLLNRIYREDGTLEMEEYLYKNVSYYPNGQVMAVMYIPDYEEDESIMFNERFYMMCETEICSVASFWTESVTNCYDMHGISWYPDGSMMVDVQYDSLLGMLVYTKYYNNGNVKESGKIYYNTWESDTEVYGCLHDDKLISSYKGYLKCGIWKYYNSDGILIEEKDYDKETVHNRRFITSN
jgi:antitoxin component YwqK of YwqJK toxin-antitoxin module